MRVRRAVLMSVAAIALLLAAPSTARADLDFGALMDFLDELMKSAGLGAWVDELAAIVAIFEQTFEPELYLENPTIYSPDDAAERAGEVYENRLDQVVSANDMAAEIRLQMPVTELTLTALAAANRNPYSIYYALQLANEINLQSAEAINKTNALLAETAQVELDQHAMESWNQEQAIALAEHRFGNGHGMWHGMKTWQADPIDTPW